MMTDEIRVDRYRTLEVDLGDRPRIARGGGYSYAPASFGPGTVVQDMRDLDRILAIDEPARVVTVEAGATLRKLYEVLTPRGLALPVQPGYPEITIGGCIAANVNAKNSHRAGTFVRAVESITLVHPSRGRVDIDRRTAPVLFDLTCGGYGLTGTIVSATLRLEPLEADTVVVRRIPVASLTEALRVLESARSEEPFAYSWHDPSTFAQRFGRGIVSMARHGGTPSSRSSRRYPVVTSTMRAAIPVGMWNPMTIAIANEGIWRAESARTRETIEDLFAFLFPFARNPFYFLFFGSRGFVETQLLIPAPAADGFLREVERQARRIRPAITLLSLKLVSGARRFLRFDGDGSCLALDVVPSPEGLTFLSVLDDMIADARGIPNVIKDTRSPRAVIERCYEEIDRFRDELRRWDPHRLYRSELSERLGL